MKETKNTAIKLSSKITKEHFSCICNLQKYNCLHYVQVFSFYAKAWKINLVCNIKTIVNRPLFVKAENDLSLVNLVTCSCFRSHVSICFPVASFVVKLYGFYILYCASASFLRRVYELSDTYRCLWISVLCFSYVILKTVKIACNWQTKIFSFNLFYFSPYARHSQPG